MTELVTIGMPVYNRPVEMARAIESVLSQSYLNLEILISNNNSPNPEVEVVAKNFQNKDSRIQYFFQSSSIHPFDHFKFLKEKASGEFFMWLADDDWLDVNFIKDCLYFLKNNKDFSCCTGKCNYIENNIILSDDSSKSITNNNKLLRVFKYISTVSINGYFYGLYPKTVIDKVKFNNSLGIDWKVIATVLFVGKIKVLDTTHHFISKGGASNNSATFKEYGYLATKLIGLSSAISLTKYIYQNLLSNYNFISKSILSLIIFVCTYKNILIWDILFLKRKLIIFLGINKTGVIDNRN